jgi:hypothetical protein
MDWLTPIITVLWIISNVLIVYNAVALLVFTVMYRLLFNPKATTAGRYIFRFFLSLLGVFAIVFVGVFVEPSYSRDWWEMPADLSLWRSSARVVVYGYVTFTISALFVTLLLRKWWPHKIKTAIDKELLVPRKTGPIDILEENNGRASTPS